MLCWAASIPKASQCDASVKYYQRVTNLIRWHRQHFLCIVRGLTLDTHCYPSTNVAKLLYNVEKKDLRFDQSCLRSILWTPSNQRERYVSVNILSSLIRRYYVCISVSFSFVDLDIHLSLFKCIQMLLWKPSFNPSAVRLHEMGTTESFKSRKDRWAELIWSDSLNIRSQISSTNSLASIILPISTREEAVYVGCIFDTKIKHVVTWSLHNTSFQLQWTIKRSKSHTLKMSDCNWAKRVITVGPLPDKNISSSCDLKI